MFSICIVKLEVENFEHLHSNSSWKLWHEHLRSKTRVVLTKVWRWRGGWVDGRAGLRIAYSNQKLNLVNNSKKGIFLTSLQTPRSVTQNLKLFFNLRKRCTSSNRTRRTTSSCTASSPSTPRLARASGPGSSTSSRTISTSGETLWLSGQPGFTLVMSWLFYVADPDGIS